MNERRTKNKIKENVYHFQRESDDAGMHSVTGCIGILDKNADVELLLLVLANGIK